MDFRSKYLEAVKRDQDVRDAAYLGLTTTICGVEVRQMTVQDIIILDGIGNPFLAGGIHSVQDSIKFLWLLSPAYLPGKWAAFRFSRKRRKLNDEDLTAGIERFLDDTFQDAPGRRGESKQADFASFAAHIVHNLASAYGWTPEVILSLPLKIIFQQLKCIRCDKEEKPELRSRRLLKVQGDRLREINQLNRERIRILCLLRSRAGMRHL